MGAVAGQRPGCAPSRQRSGAARTRGATAPHGRRGEGPANERSERAGGRPEPLPTDASLSRMMSGDETRSLTGGLGGGGDALVGAERGEVT